MRKFFVLPSVLLILLILGACSSSSFKADHHYKVKPFEFTNQHKEKVSLDDMNGDVWLAQFVFTNCTSVCGPMMYHMAELQDLLIDEGVSDYKIVSFSVDPDVDTPEKMQEYLEIYAPKDESKWEMLSGYTLEEIADLSVKSFKMACC